MNQPKLATRYYVAGILFWIGVVIFLGIMGIAIL